MGTIVSALAALKTIFAGLDASPYQDPVGVWVIPDDYENINWSDPPFIVISTLDREWLPFRPLHRGAMKHEWIAEINCCLSTGPITTMVRAVELEPIWMTWLNQVASLLGENRGLNGQALAIGSGIDLFRYRVGQFELGRRVYYGVRVQVPVLQLVQMTCD